MAAASSVVVLLLLVLVLCAASSQGDLVARSCANATDRYGSPELTNELCESMLRSDKRSAAAKHPHDLAVLAIDLVQRAGVDADATIDGVIRSGGGLSNDTMTALGYCRSDYHDLALAVPECRAMVQEYKPKPPGGDLRPYARYFKCVHGLIDAAEECRWGLTGFGDDDEVPVMKVVSKKAEKVLSLAYLTSAMVEQMLSIEDGAEPGPVLA